jgi:hypothetical protein
MTRIRRATLGVAVAVLAAGAGAFSTARAQSSGKLQVTVTVLDDLVSRTVATQVEPILRELTGSARSDAPPSAIDSRDGVAATLIELEPIGRLRRLRVEIAYLY